MEPDLVKELDLYGWMTYNAQHQIVLLKSVHIQRKPVTVAIQRMQVSFVKVSLAKVTKCNSHTGPEFMICHVCYLCRLMQPVV